MSSTLYDEMIELPRAVRFPVELRVPDGFDEERLETWPKVQGRLEYVGGRLLYLPPCGDEQQDTVADVVITLGAWVRANAEFVLGTNEAGMRLNGATRAADAAIWRRRDLGAYTRGLRRVAPVLAIEVAGDDESEDELRKKAAWYLDAGVRVVWLVLPATREVIEMMPERESRHSANDRMPEHAELPGLTPRASDLFIQIASLDPH